MKSCPRLKKSLSELEFKENDNLKMKSSFLSTLKG